jgi:hypothetical protein
MRQSNEALCLLLSDSRRNYFALVALITYICRQIWESLSYMSNGGKAQAM